MKKYIYPLITLALVTTGCGSTDEKESLKKDIADNIFNIESYELDAPKEISLNIDFEGTFDTDVTIFADVKTSGINENLFLTLNTATNESSAEQKLYYETDDENITLYMYDGDNDTWFYTTEEMDYFKENLNKDMTTYDISSWCEGLKKLVIDKSRLKEEGDCYRLITSVNLSDESFLTFLDETVGDTFWNTYCNTYMEYDEFREVLKEYGSAFYITANILTEKETMNIKSISVELQNLADASSDDATVISLKKLGVMLYIEDIEKFTNEEIFGTSGVLDYDEYYTIFENPSLN